MARLVIKSDTTLGIWLKKIIIWTPHIMVQLLGAPIHNIVKFNLSLTPNKRIIWQKVENLHATILKK